MVGNEAQTVSYRFGAFELRAQPAALTLGDDVVALPSQPLRLLLELVRRHGEIVTHDDIRSLLWPDQKIDATARIHACIRQIRRTLDADNGDPRFVETVPRMGYRFVGDVEAGHAQEPPGRIASSAIPHRWVAMIVMAIIATASVWWLSEVSRREQSTETIALSPDPFLRGRALLENGAYREAADSLAEAVAENPAFAPAHAAWSEAAYALGNASEARAFAERAIDLDATYARGYLQRAWVSGWVDGSWSAAERDLDTALALTPRAPDVLLGMAELYLLTGREEQSVAATDALLQSPSPSARVLAAIGRLRRLQRRLEEADSLCRQAAAQQPGLVAALECVYRTALVRQDIAAARTIVPALAAALGASGEEIATFADTEAANEVAAFERWRLGQDADPVEAAYSNVVLQRFDEAIYLLQQARDARSGRLPAALHDLVFVGLFHQSAYGELCRSIGVAVPRFQ